MRFLFDNCLSKKIAHAVRALSTAEGNEILHSTDRFEPNASDESIVQALANEGNWTIISGDLNIIRLEHRRRALREFKVSIFCLAPAWMKMKLWDQAWRLIRRWPDIERQANMVDPGAMFEVPVKPTGRFKQLSR